LGLRLEVMLGWVATGISEVLLFRTGLGDGGAESSRLMISLPLCIPGVIARVRGPGLATKLEFRVSLNELPTLCCDENTSSEPEMGDEDVRSIDTCAALLSLWEGGNKGEKSNFRFTLSGGGDGEVLLELLPLDMKVSVYDLSKVLSEDFFRLGDTDRAATGGLRFFLENLFAFLSALRSSASMSFEDNDSCTGDKYSLPRGTLKLGPALT